MPDRLPGQPMRKNAPEQLTPKERREQVAAILARGVARYLRNSLPGANHVPDFRRRHAHLASDGGSQKPPELSPQGP